MRSSPTGFGFGNAWLLSGVLELSERSSIIRFSFFVPFVARDFVVGPLPPDACQPSLSTPSRYSLTDAGRTYSFVNTRRSHTSPLPKRKTTASASWYVETERSPLPRRSPSSGASDGPSITRTCPAQAAPAQQSARPASIAILIVSHFIPAPPSPCLDLYLTTITVPGAPWRATRYPSRTLRRAHTPSGTPSNTAEARFWFPVRCLKLFQ